MEFYQYENRLARPMMMKLPELQRNDRLKHMIFAQQFDKSLLKHLGNTADMIRELSKSRAGSIFLTGLLPHKRAMLYFTQASTRTYLSFLAASQVLGLSSGEIRDPSLSSEFKGEHPLDSMRMFSSYFDIIFIRSKVPALAESAAYLMNDLDHFNQRNVPIVNGGSGADEHPTQALLDIYTIQRTFAFTSKKDSKTKTRFDELRKTHPKLTKGLDNKVYCFCGDIGRGRTVRSLAQLLALFSNTTMIFVSPKHPKLALPAELRRSLIGAGVKVEEADSLQEVCRDIDLLYMTRIQNEHDSPDDQKFFASVDMSQYRLTTELVQQMRDYAPIMHPFPRNEEIPFDIDSDPRAMYFREARNGMWSRAALIAHLFDVDSKIAAHYQETYSSFHDYNLNVL